ncbi:PIN domain-containing protein [Methylovulum miyakonense]|uniref:PIN domain-containing protein n=1 Tax=Methylovulum miyakonense TaxID=645578 RepID=UPI000365596F|nr:PIN domain-containing protein [Methylovulum miyakonense]
MNYFIDTNLIIDAFDKKKPEAISKLAPILEDEDSEIFVNRLVYLETLRTVKLSHRKDFDALKEIFDGFTFLDINPYIYEQAIGLSRYCQSKGVTLKGQDTCAAIDFLHFATAKHYGLELLANDRDMEKLTDIYPDWLASGA